MNTTAMLQNTISTLSAVMMKEKGAEYALGYMTSLLESAVEQYVTDDRKVVMLEDLVYRVNDAARGK